jgi:hypothetical protein
MVAELFDLSMRRRHVISPDKRCPEIRADGQPCEAPMTSTGKCAGHSRIGATANSETARRAQEASRRVFRENAAARRRAEDSQKRGVVSALRTRALANTDLLLDALFAPLDDKDLPAKVRQEAALKILERAFGRPGQSPTVPEGQELTDMTIEELEAAWSEMPTYPTAEQIEPPSDPYVARTHIPHPD